MCEREMNNFLKEQSDKHGKPIATEYLLESSLQGIAWYIKKINSKKIIVISGAGISVPADIPDFRSTDVGLYHAPFVSGCYVCDVFTKKYFLRRPQPLYILLKLLMERTYSPTLSHYFIALLKRKKMLLRNYTLNMDNLEKQAGVPDSKIVPINGTFFTFSCVNCNESYETNWTTKRILDQKIPQCRKCGGLIKPDLTFYGDPLPPLLYKKAAKDFPRCELLIILGTTLSSEPFATILRDMDISCPRLFINDTEPYNFSDFDFFATENIKDVLWIGDCDAGIVKLAELLGWTEELFLLANISQPETNEQKTST